jgi:hypothetical protein
MKSPTLLLYICILVTGCVSVEVCDENNDSEMVASFKTRHDGVPADTTVSAFIMYGIREGKPDSLLYNGVSASFFAVPLDPHYEYSRYVLSIDNQIDTLTIYQHHEIYMISYTCGFANLFTIEDIEYRNGIIKSDTIVKEMVDAVYEKNEVHIWLYL